MRGVKPKLGQPPVVERMILRTQTSIGTDLAVDDMLMSRAQEEEEAKKMNDNPMAPETKQKINQAF